MEIIYNFNYYSENSRYFTIYILFSFSFITFHSTIIKHISHFQKNDVVLKSIESGSHINYSGL